MVSENLKNRQISIQFSEEDGWTLSKDDLDNHLKENFDELRQHALAAKDISSRKMKMAVILVTAITIIVASMALAGAHLFAFILALIAVADVAPILKFLDQPGDG